ncbi:MAG: hypothetical protein AAFY08_16190 [Planctomycetota bacterium]
MEAGAPGGSDLAAVGVAGEGEVDAEGGGLDDVERAVGKGDGEGAFVGGGRGLGRVVGLEGQA